MEGMGLGEIKSDRGKVWDWEKLIRINGKNQIDLQKGKIKKDGG